MGTKFLARTVIEGGRSHYNIEERRHSHAGLRARDRAYLARVAADPDHADGTPAAVLPHVRKDFSDKLGPAKRWLRSRVGKDWDATFAEMVRKFDTRTIPGRHIVYDHMLPWVKRDDLAERWWRPEFVVDAQGILREGPCRPRWPREPYVCDYEELRAWLGDRMVCLRGKTLFWLVPTIMRERIGRGPKWTGGVVTLSLTGRYRQDKALDDEEARRWLAFSTGARKKVWKERMS